MRKSIHAVDGSVQLSNLKRKVVNKELAKIGKEYYKSIPLNDIFKILRKERIVVVDEDGENWSGMLLGSDGTERFDLALLNADDDKASIDNSMLILSWHRMESGRYEVIPYLS